MDRLNGNRIEDSSDNDHEAICANDRVCPTVTAGVYDNAIAFDRDEGDFFTVAPSPALRPTTELTVAAFIRVDDLAAEIYQCIASQPFVGTDTDTNTWLMCVRANGALVFNSRHLGTGRSISRCPA